METATPQDSLLTLLADTFPYAVVEGVFDPRAFLAGLGITEPQDNKLYTFSWLGKSDAEAEASRATSATLVPNTKRSVRWDDTEHILVEGSNSQALKVLISGLRSAVKLIYIDPPYNTGKTFIYNDDFRVTEEAYLVATGQVDDKGRPLTSRPELAGSKHAPWLTMMLPSLFHAWHLLSPDGALFVSIDDNECQHMRLLLDAIFGQDNRLATLVWNRGHSQQAGIFKEYHEYVLVYAKDRDGFAPFGAEGDDIDAGAQKIESSSNRVSDFTFPAGTRCEAADGTELVGRWGDAEWTEIVSGRFRVSDGALVEHVTLRAAWTQRRQMEQWFYGNQSEVFDTRRQRVKEFYFSSTGKLRCRKERRVFTPQTVLDYGTQANASGDLKDLFGGIQAFDRPKPVRMMRDFAKWVCTDDGDIALDFFAGSGTLGHGVLLANEEDGVRRRYVLVQAPEPLPEDSPARTLGFSTVFEVMEERLKRAALQIAADGSSTDRGFRCFSLASTSLPEVRAVRYSDLEAALPDMVPNAVRTLPSSDFLKAAWEIVLKATPFGPQARVEMVEEAVFVASLPGKPMRYIIVLKREADLSVLDPLAPRSSDTVVIGANALSDTDLVALARRCHVVRLERVSNAIKV